ncbi:MAG: prepilin-type N-terminal cleavage/methylation domain-containing protein [Campylobacterales bacterium]|nr:prepilin-type N-terminal cleavage/methylation domain-containing protein [Campylobacterales bacterium]
MKRSAFTMLELIFVIIVIGILAVFAMPNFNRHPLQEAAEQVASHIRYTQHLAMVDDKFDPSNANWWQRKWQLTIAGTSYNVYSDINENGGFDAGEAAVDPLTKTPISAVDLAAKYGITTITAKTLAFDNMGRPYNGFTTDVYTDIITAETNVTLTHNDGTAIITVQPETGYVSVTYP